MRLHNRRTFSKPEVMIIPMIDIMFFLLVFFMLSTLYMVNIKTTQVDMPKTQNAMTTKKINYLVTINKDGLIYLENNIIDIKTLLHMLKLEKEKNPNIAVIIRADKKTEYDNVMNLLDKLKGIGVVHIGLSSENKL